MCKELDSDTFEVQFQVIVNDLQLHSHNADTLSLISLRMPEKSAYTFENKFHEIVAYPNTLVGISLKRLSLGRPSYNINN